jgi:hypothetical protein
MSGNEGNAKKRVQANGPTDVSSAVFVVIVRDDYRHLNGEGSLSSGWGHRKRPDFAHEVAE